MFPDSHDAIDQVRSSVEHLSADDDRSIREGEALSGDGRRLEHLKQSVHWTVVWAVRIAGISMLGLLVVRVWHMASPDMWIWLDSERLQKIDSLLFSGFVGAFIARYLNQAMPVSGVSKNKWTRGSRGRAGVGAGHG